MNRDHFHQKSHENTSSRNTVFNNSNKFRIKSENNARSEINAWVSKNKNSDIKLVSHEGNHITISILHNGKKHLIEIIYPKLYPKDKKGFSCKEINIPNITPMNFVPKVNDHLTNKTLSVERVIEHLVDTFIKYKSVKRNDDVQNQSNVIFNTNAVVEPESWTEIGNISNSKSDDSNDNNNTPPVVKTENNDIPEMINLEPTSTISDISKDTEGKNVSEILNDIDIINKILESNDKDNIQTTNNENIGVITNVSENNLIVPENINEPANKTTNELNENSTKIDTMITDEPNENSTELDNKITDELIGNILLDMANEKENENIVQLLNSPQENVPKIDTKQENVPKIDINQEDKEYGKDYDAFIVEQIGILEDKNPGMKEEDMMDIIQKKWDNRNSKSEISDDDIDETQPTSIKKADRTTNNDDSESTMSYDSEIIDDDNFSQETNETDKRTTKDKLEESENEESEKETEKEVDDDDDEEKEVEEEKPEKNETEEEENEEEEKPEKKNKMRDDDGESENEAEEEEEKPIMKSDNKLGKKSNYEDDDRESENEDEEEEMVEVKPINKSELTKKSDKKPDKKFKYVSEEEEIEEKEEKEEKPMKNKKPEKKSDDENDDIKTKKKTNDNNQIGFDDVDDSMGLYLDLSEYTKTRMMPFDMDKLSENARKLQNEMEFGNVTKIKNSFNSSSAIRVVCNEFKRVYNMGLRNNYSVMPINDNIYHLKFKFEKKFFDTASIIYSNLEGSKTYVEIDMKIDSKLYPFYPPKIRLISPRLKNHMNCRIATMECLLLSNWNPIYGLETIIDHFRNLMNKYAEIESTTIHNYDDLENDLIELSLLSEIPARINSVLTIDELKNIKNTSQTLTKSDRSKKSGKHWTNGIGYGHNGLAEWDVNSTIKAIEERDKQLAKCIKNITKRLTKIIITNVNIDSVEIIKNSCFIPYLKSIFYGNSILELLKNPSSFESLLNSIRIMTNKFVPIFLIKDGENGEKSLFEIFNEINADCKIYLKTIKKSTDTKSKAKSSDKDKQADEIKTELDLVSNFVNFYKRLEKQIKELEINDTNNNSITPDEKKKSLREIYKNSLMKEMCQHFEDMNLNRFDNLMKEVDENINTPFINNKPIQQISKEIISHSKNLPIEFESSIFYRYNENNLKFHEFIITGPEGTPYDSGCFHFRMYCGSNYPEKNPRVNICTTGNGNVSFNPNLYSSGRICLSLLGTFSGQKGESWIPGTSTMFQIMISIQSLVMNAEPYFNEAGSENLIKTDNGKKSSVDYNYTVRLNCMKWAMIDMIKNPVKGFENAIRTHFKLKTDHIKQVCNQWVSEAPAKLKSDYNETYKKLCDELDKLGGKKTSESKKDVPVVKKKPAPQKKILNKISDVVGV